MKLLTTVAALFGTLSILPCHAEPDKAAPVVPSKKPAEAEPGPKTAPRGADVPDVSKVILSPPPKAATKRRSGGRTTIMATRADKKDTIKLVALAPADDGVTIEDQPRLWWWQSKATEAGELEFVLSKLVADREEGQPETVLAVAFGPLRAGFNAIDLSHALINKKNLRLEEGGEYQWSVGCRDGNKKDAFFVRLRRVGNVELANQWKEEPSAVPTLNSLSSSGNWYELFDAVAFPSFRDPGNEAFVKLRGRLLAQVGLESALTP